MPSFCRTGNVPAASGPRSGLGEPSAFNRRRCCLQPQLGLLTIPAVGLGKAPAVAAPALHQSRHHGFFFLLSGVVPVRGQISSWSALPRKNRGGPPGPSPHCLPLPSRLPLSSFLAATTACVYTRVEYTRRKCTPPLLHLKGKGCVLIISKSPVPAQSLTLTRYIVCVE